MRMVHVCKWYYWWSWYSTSHTGHTVARGRLNRLNTYASTEAFKAVFLTVENSHSGFKVGKTLQGIVVDWSEQQVYELEAVVGKETVEKVIKGCQVHFTRSVKWVSERVNKGNPLAHKAFATIAYHTLKAKFSEHVMKLFSILAGEADISEAAVICDHQQKSLDLYTKSHSLSSWQGCKHWVKWWRCPKQLSKFVHVCESGSFKASCSLIHQELQLILICFLCIVGMLSVCCSEMGVDVFQSLPDSTNAVKSHNRCSKGDKPDTLKIAMLSTYKVDMASALEHLANSTGIKMNYVDLTSDARAKHSAKANKARARERTQKKRMTLTNHQTNAVTSKSKVCNHISHYTCTCIHMQFKSVN